MTGGVIWFCTKILRVLYILRGHPLAVEVTDHGQHSLGIGECVVNVAS